MTQARAAYAVGVSQQTVARWEGGSVEPGLAAVGDLAALYGHSLDRLVGGPHLTSTRTKKQAFLVALDRMAGQWGFFGIRPPGAWKSAWFPVCAWAADTFAAAPDRCRSWAVVPTLNNRVLIINLAARIRCELVPSGAKVFGDWDLPWDANANLDLAAYQELARLPFGGSKEPERKEAATLSDQLHKFVLPRSAVLDLDARFRSVDFVYDQVLATRIRMNTGEEFTEQASGPGLWKAVCEADADALSLVELRARPKGRRSFLAAACLWLLDMPAIRVLDSLEQGGVSE